jgi:AcrR family transcriptional regulator
MPYPKKIAEADILSHALAIVRQGGVPALSMRTLAGQLGVRASSLYRHFPGRDSLEGALSESAAKILGERMREVSQGKKPAGAFRAIGIEYVRFASGERALFELLLAGAYQSGKGSQGKRLWNFILETVSAVTLIPDDTAAAVAVWSFLHGFAILERSGKFGASGPQGAFDAGIEALREGLADSKRRRKPARP